VPVVARYETFYGIYDAYLRDAPKGTIARYAMAHPGLYPGDEPYVNALREDENAPLLVADKFIDSSRALVARGVSLQRLVVAHGPGEAGYDPEYLGILKKSFAEMNGAKPKIEDTRVAWYGHQVVRLLEVCGGGSEWVQQYMYGAETGVPKVGLWTVQYPGLYLPKAIGVMNYRGGDRAFEPVDIWEAPYPPGLEHLTRFWEEVFHDQSVDLQKLDLAA
jgi:hypothetical protein